MTLRIVPATAEDIPAIAALHVEGWKAAYGGLVDQGYLDSLSAEKRMATWAELMASGESRTLIAEIDGRAAGFCTTGRTKTPPPGSSPIRPSHSGEVYALYLHPDFWRQGVGTALLRAGAKDLKEHRHSSLCLWVLDGNSRARAFYEKMNGQKLGGRMIEIGPSTLKEVCYGWRDTAVLLS